MKIHRLSASPVCCSLLLVALLGLLTPIFNPASAAYEVKISRDLPVQASSVETVVSARLPSLVEFVDQVRNGIVGDLVGVYVPGILAFPIVDQPSGNYGYVSSRQGVVTLFGLAKNNDSIGLLAHNNLAGKDFIKLLPLMRVILVYGDGKIQPFTITDVRYFHALEPNSPYSDFEDVENLGVYLTAVEVFEQIYGESDRLVFQTCIEAAGDPAWGRLFVTAEPVRPISSGNTGSNLGIGFGAQ